MNRNDNDLSGDKFSMGISVVIALCVIGVFCAISVAVIENLQTRTNICKTKHVSLPNSKDLAGLVI
jgi:hypothetical protein